MQALANARYGRIGLTVALLAALLVVAVGGGYSASKALLDDGAAYAVDGVGIDRLNAATGAPDAELLDMALGPNRIRVVHRDKQVYLVDTVRASVTRLDPATLLPAASSKGPGQGTGSVEVVTGGGATALADLTKGLLQRVNQETLVAIGRAIKVPGGMTGAVADSKGTIWVASASAGIVLRVERSGKSTVIPVASEGSSLTVTLVGDAPVAVELPIGRITSIDTTTLRRSRTATLPTPVKDRLLVSGADTPLPNLWALDVATHGLYRVDLGKGTVDGPITIGAGQTQWDTPLVQAGKVYVPNKTDHRLVVVDGRSLHRLDELVVPGDGPDFDLTLEGGALWANDPTNGKALVVNREGEAREVGKGNGEGRLDPTPVPVPAGSDVAPGTAPAPDPGTSLGPVVQPPIDLTQKPGVPAVPATPAMPAPPVPAPPADSVVPDVRGFERAAACAALETAKLVCDATDEDGGDIGKVSKQAPAPGRAVPPGGKVSIAIGRGVVVPSVTGTLRDAACTSVRDAKLTCVPQGVTWERGKTRDQVFEQDPAPDTQVDERATVVVRYWGDPRKLAVPDVTGKTPTQACADLATAGFTCTEVAGSGRPLGRVAAQVPATGQADEGSAVTVTVATRTTMPILTPTESSATFCTNLSRDLGLPAANCSKAPADLVKNPPNTVDSTTPAAGAEVTLATLVTYVRRGGAVTVPDVAGRPDAEACNTLRAAGLGACTATNAGEGPAGSLNTVAPGGQAPAANAVVLTGTAVNIAVYRTQRVIVPAVGGDIDAACATIQSAGLGCATTVANTGNYRQVDSQSPAGGTQVSAGSTVTVAYEPSVRKPLYRFRRGSTGTETDTWALTANDAFYGVLTGAGFTDEIMPLCSAYQDGEGYPGRTALVDWVTSAGPGGPVHHSANTTPGSPPGGTGWTVNHDRTAYVAVGGRVTIYLITRGYGHYFTASPDEAKTLLDNRNFLAGPFPAFTCW